jgi:2-(1,2-epoxy-1,2-dihydrophenyl)acetyl-CoA isomerase
MPPAYDISLDSRYRRPMENPWLKLEVRDRLARLTLARPERSNAIDLELAQGLADAAASLAEERALGAVLLAGEGANFCVGGDVKTFATRSERLPEYLRSLATALHTAVSRLVRLDVPLVAAVQGAAAGAGMSLACAADFVIAADSARFTMAYTKIGLSPDGGSSYTLARIVGVRRALELVITNRLLTAEEAREWGIVTKVVPAADLAREAVAFAQPLAQAATGALRAAKRLFREGFDESLETQLERETREIVEASRTADANEGIAAFVERRPPRFHG